MLFRSYEIIKYLYNRFRNASIVILPNATKYPRKELASNHHRLAMLTLLIEEFKDRVSTSTLEMDKVTFEGTYYTLQSFDDPYFVIGTDNLADLPTWIEHQKLIEQTHFLVMNRKGFDFKQIIDHIPILKDHKDQFVYLDDFVPVDASSSTFRQNKDFSLVNKKIQDYINEHKLY